MTRPLRIEFPGAVYHITTRGDRREPIFEDDVDRTALLAVMAQGMERFDARCLAYCLMGNHYHLVLWTRQANLSRLMRHINGVYTQRFNRRHSKEGHLFQGRFKAILVDRDAYLLSLCRYVEGNPVAARLVDRAADWLWSSCRAHLGIVATPRWLDTDGLLGNVLERPIATASDRRAAIARYSQLVQQAAGTPLWDNALRQQIYLGNDAFVDRMQEQAASANVTAVDIPRTQRHPPQRHTLNHWLKQHAERNAAIHQAYKEGGLTMSAIAQDLGLSISRVSRLIAEQERQAKGKT